MFAVTLPSYGGPDVLTWAEVPDPEPGVGEVLIHVAAAGVNRADVVQRQGHYSSPPGVPTWPGLECSGVVSAVGEAVTAWSVGDEVCALLSGGGYAERVAVPAGQLLPVPADVSLVEAAALPEVVCTVWSNVFLLARLQRGEAFLVHGGSSGIGTMAIQLARRAGARVFTTAGTAAKLERCVELGADVAINYREEDFVRRVMDETDGSGVDVILDNMGAAYLDRNLRSLAGDGRLAVIGLQGGRTGELDLGRLLSRRAAVFATSLRGRPGQQKTAIVEAVRRDVWPAIPTGEIRPVVHLVLPMEDAAEAHRVLEASEHVGKVLLRTAAG